MIKLYFNDEEVTFQELLSRIREIFPDIEEDVVKELITQELIKKMGKNILNLDEHEKKEIIAKSEINIVFEDFNKGVDKRETDVNGDFLEKLRLTGEKNSGGFDFNRGADKRKTDAGEDFPKFNLSEKLQLIGEENRGGFDVDKVRKKIEQYYKKVEQKKDLQIVSIDSNKLLTLLAKVKITSDHNKGAILEGGNCEKINLLNEYSDKEVFGKNVKGILKGLSIPGRSKIIYIELNNVNNESYFYISSINKGEVETYIVNGKEFTDSLNRNDKKITACKVNSNDSLLKEKLKIEPSLEEMSLKEMRKYYNIDAFDGIEKKEKGIKL